MTSDEQLSARGARGETPAFETIFRRYHQDLYRFCLAMTGNADDAQDALQNTMVKVLRALPGEKRQIQLRPWLYRIARNESIETLRKRRDDAQLEPHQGTVAGPAETAETRARLRQLLADLEQLPRRQRAALTMRELSGLSYAEIAVALNSSEAAARQTLYEARLSLRQLEAGREMRCASVMRELSDADGRVTRRREIQAHLRGCADCRAFQREIHNRNRDLSALAPLPVAASSGLMQSLLAQQAGAAGAGVASAGGAGGLAVAGGKAITASAVVKSAATVAVVAAIGIGAERSHVIDLGGSDRGANAPQRSGTPAAGDHRAGGDAGPQSRQATGPGEGKAGAPAGSAGDTQPGHGGRPRDSHRGAHGAAVPSGDGHSAADAGAAPPGGGHGRAAAENGGRPAGLPAAADGGQQAANARKPAGAGGPEAAGKPAAPAKPQQAEAAPPIGAGPPAPPAAKPAAPPSGPQAPVGENGAAGSQPAPPGAEK